jgi:DNA-binding MarR family transcriptional regulator
VTNLDPTERGYWRPLIALQQRMEADIAALYEKWGLSGVRPRFAYPMIRLAHRGPMTIRDLAESLGRTHSALSQTVTAMRDEGLVETVRGVDARTRVVRLTERGRSLIPLLETEWRATEDAIEALLQCRDVVGQMDRQFGVEGLDGVLGGAPFGLQQRDQ